MKNTFLISLFLFWLFSVSFQALATNSSSIEIDLISRQLTLFLNGKVSKIYPIAVPKSKNFMTPRGEFEIVEKDNAPGWQNPFNRNIKITPGSNNPLGTRWMGFLNLQSQSFGIHGTNNPGSIGKMVSHGCIRMQVKDSEELFEYIELGTPVKVKYERFIVQKLDDEITLSINEDPYGVEQITQENIKKHIWAKFPEAKLYEKTIQYLSDNGEVGQTRIVGFLETQNLAKKEEPFKSNSY